MAFTGNFMSTSFKQELLEGLHDFNASGGNTYKLALYDNTATLNASTTVYTTSGEISGTGYTAGGADLTNVDPTTSGTTGFTDFDNLTFSTATITARGALIYNSTNGNRAVVVLDFGADKTSTAGDFTIVFPTADASNAIVRIA
tara:strand:+ start:1655 stop:2086 length:432 start_codon:yes stop_codon:yes gene_type:complete